MTLPEIVELFGTTAAAVYAGIKAILKENALHDYEVCKCIRLDTYPAAALRSWVVRKATTPVRTAPPIILRYGDGVLN